MQRTGVAVAPSLAPWAVEGVEKGGGMVVDVSEAEALVWLEARKTQQLGEVLDANPQLKWIHVIPAGVETLMKSGLVDSSRVWTCGKDVYGPAVAEHALALMLALRRSLVPYARAVEWSDEAGSSLRRSTVVVVGAGGIARELIRLLAPFGCRTIVVRNRALPFDGAYRVTQDLDEVLGEADVVVLAAAVTDRTRRLIDRGRLQKMRPNALVINVARGELVDTEALTDALIEGRIGGAGLDVTDPEPLPAGHPLWRLDNCLITPHTANPSILGRPAATDRIAANVRSWIADEPMVGLIDPELGY